jgi:hypothetical protein
MAQDDFLAHMAEPEEKVTKTYQEAASCRGQKISVLI